ncbi:MAG: adenylate/guanylate cyclase domain-containing protein, partial [Chloroflexaceae bacterium]|nr:adenylate/guanylate cyclase domain-containing protein [Chloroflexaceae bacterium]
QQFAVIETAQHTLSLNMRIGLHRGRFLSANIGTPRRMEYVLLGRVVQQTKRAEASSKIGRVNISQTVADQVTEQFRLEPSVPGYHFVVDDFTDEQLGEYDISLKRRRMVGGILLDRSTAGVIEAIDDVLQRTEQLASYLPRPVLTLLVESAADRKLRPEFTDLTVMFVNLTGVPGAADQAPPGEEYALIDALSRAFALINAAVEAQGGVLKNVSCDYIGSSMLIYFGVPNAHTNDSLRAAAAALTIRRVAMEHGPAIAGDTGISISCQIGLARGPVFAAEIGEPRGRRELNILGDIVNTAARLMSNAKSNQILITEPMYNEIAHSFRCEPLPPMALKGKAVPVRLYALHDWLEQSR